MQDPPSQDVDDPLWRQEDIDNAKSRPFDKPTRTVVSVDPAVSNTATSDEHGIIVSSLHERNQFTNDADYSRKGSASEWARTAMRAYEKHKAVAIVVEINQGGDMVIETLRNCGFKGKIIRVHASKGKTTRAEPIAALYAGGYVKHLPHLDKLEKELLDFDPRTGLSNNKSPNRMDAMVWAITELSKNRNFFIS